MNMKSFWPVSINNIITRNIFSPTNLWQGLGDVIDFEGDSIIAELKEEVGDYAWREFEGEGDRA